MDPRLNQLVREIKNGLMDSFDELYQLTYRKVFFIALGVLHDSQLAEDIVQDTYLKMLESIQEYREKNFLAYLLTIAKNLAINEYNRRKRISFTSEEIDTYIEINLEDYLQIKAEKRELIQKSLACLDVLEKNVFLLYTIENLTHKEIAFILEKPIGTITWIYQKALKKIRQKIKEEYDEIS